MTIFIIIGAIILFIIIVAIITPNHMTIKREIVINKPAREVFDYIKMLKNQECYSKWVMMDPNVKLEYLGTDGTVGSLSKWDSQMHDAGKGEQEIIAMEDGKSMDVEIRFERPFKGISKARNEIISESETTTKVVNIYDADTPFPMNIFSQLMKGKLGADMQENLVNLKGQLEK